MPTFKDFSRNLGSGITFDLDMAEIDPALG